jgi:4-diphosphocytidyl-2-C-methyl-D-erythritol kinase
MVAVSLYDEIEITKRKLAKSIKYVDRLTVTSDTASLPEGEKNIVYRAAKMFMETANSNELIKIHIRKRIPVGAGLGGGSSDAAATLIGLNRLLRLKYSSQMLKKMAYSLGADVPFFIEAVPARARGIGEQLSRIAKPPWNWAILLYPGFPIETGWVYQNFQPTLTKLHANTSITSLLKKPSGRKRMLVNDLETVTLARYPQIGLLKRKLIEEGAVSSLMSGSGSAVFGLFESKERATKAFSQLRKEEEVEAFLVRLLI